MKNRKKDNKNSSLGTATRIPTKEEKIKGYVGIGAGVAVLMLAFVGFKKIISG